MRSSRNLNDDELHGELSKPYSKREAKRVRKARETRRNLLASLTQKKSVEIKAKIH